MSKETLYVSNFPPENTHEALLEELFSQYDEVKSIEFGTNEKFDVPYALVTLGSEKAATRAMHGLNGHKLEDRYLSICYPEVIDDAIERGLSAKQRQTAETVVKALGEEYRKPVRRIYTMVLLCGHSFVLHLLKEAQEIDAGEGMLTLDGSRKRTLGGTFFRIANMRMPLPIYQIVHSRGGKLPNYQKEDDRMFYHLILNPHEDI